MIQRKLSILFGLSAALIAVTASHHVLADTITETEPNDSVATANQLIGTTNDLVALGAINDIGTHPDIDVFRFSVTSPGTVQINAFGSLSGGSLTLDNVDLLALNNQGSQGQIIGQDISGGVHNGQITLTNLADGVYYAAVFSGDNPKGTHQGTYRLDVYGTGGAVVSGVAAPIPEASTTVSFGLLLALGLGGVVFVAHKKRDA